MHSRRNEAGFTLIEIAIVVVIIGLLLGGVLKGQELIRNARTHAIINQGNAVQGAVLGFQDRYRALPGDYSVADTNIVGVTTDHNGDGDSRVGILTGDEGGGSDDEIVFVWEHLSRAGFISGSFDGSNTNLNDTTWTCGEGACLTNPFNGHMMFLFDGAQVHPDATTWSTGPQNNQLTTGRLIPVEITAEMDRKIDDGDPANGSFRVGHRFLSGATGAATECANVATGSAATVVDTWTVTSLKSDCWR
ncbi:MAG: prepilin-type N-terminal cleavage/methylation domain-containing protein [Magnetococcales bacterium]|nr:prepilin-type N-terminal cleavage/methylation domain-containing protein [Magnetococcales bacterium]